MNKRLIAAAAILFIFFSSTAFYPWQIPMPQRALLQETAYPIESETPAGQPTGYDGPEMPTDTPAYPGVPSTLEPPVDATLTASPQSNSTSGPTLAKTLTPTTGPSPTPGRDLFSTEDAEIQNSRVTPRASETAPPSRTPQHSVTPMPSRSPTPSPPFVFDSSWFLAGLFIPAGLLFVAWLIFRMKNSGEFKT